MWATGDNRYGQLGDGTKVHKTSFIKVVASGQCDNATADLRNRPTIISAPHALRHTQDYSPSHYRLQTCPGTPVCDCRLRLSLILVTSSRMHPHPHVVYAPFDSHLERFCPLTLHAGVKAISAGGRHSMILMADGSVWATGDNQYGQLGDDTFVSKSNYVKVARRGAL